MAKRNEASLLVLVAMAVVVFLSVQVKSEVAVSSYTTYTTDMQLAVRKEVNAFPDLRPGLIRLLFHDCWVNGCDGSVLLNYSRNSSTNGETEKDSGFNLGLRGQQVIQNIKTNLGPKYNITCTDAVIYAAREAVFTLSKGNIAYNVAGPGRMDGVISRKEDPEQFLPAPSFTFEQLKTNFWNKSFSPDDLVVLSGAHCVGVAHSSNPLTFFDVNMADTPPAYRAAIDLEMAMHGKVVKINPRDFDLPPFGYNSHYKVNMWTKDVLDNSVYNAVDEKMAFFKSDRVLRVDAKEEVKKYMDEPGTWNKYFGDAMARLSKLAAPSGAPSEIRNVCSKTNY